MVLIVGVVGYIGRHTNKLLTQKGYQTLVYDNLIYGHKESVKWGEFILGDLNDIEQLRLIFSKYKIGAVMHCSLCKFNFPICWETILQKKYSIKIFD